MNPRTGEIKRVTDEEAEQDGLIPLDEREARELESVSPFERKNWMRNMPCRCGSGIKFKKCCWSKYGRR